MWEVTLSLSEAGHQDIEALFYFSICAAEVSTKHYFILIESIKTLNIQEYCREL